MTMQRAKQKKENLFYLQSQKKENHLVHGKNVRIFFISFEIKYSYKSEISNAKILLKYKNKCIIL